MHYIQWFISFPLVLLELLLATGLSLSDIFTTLFMSIVLVITGLVGALVPSTYKWGYFTFGVLALTLRPDGYDWRFVAAAEEPFEDAGSATCDG